MIERILLFTIEFGITTDTSCIYRFTFLPLYFLQYFYFVTNKYF